ncbi:hypothetical protein C0992_000171 [Termitomyces sp. T32_za158]|nr:hypothetical protein C0992_000171 [Termitomyces sp. T32_za158]
MSLRRLAQANNAATSTGSPRNSGSTSTNNSPRPGSTTLPSTPRNRTSIGTYRSPASTPSISSSIPFDWDAARARKPPPYGTSFQNKARQSTGVGTPVKRVIRKKGLVERITSIPSRIAFEISLFPHNVPFPEAATSGRIIGGLLHFIHFCVRVSQSRKVPDSDIGWEDMYHEGEGTAWFDWVRTTTPVTVLLLAGAFLNAVYLFTRIRMYRLHQRPDLVSSPNARFVSAQLDFEPLEVPSLGSRLGSGMWYCFSYSWRWLLGMQLPTRTGQIGGKTARVQQLEVWAPGQFEMVLFTIYSPAHVILWMATGTTNWIAMAVIMGLVWAQLNAMVYWYTGLLKDKEIIAAEVMNEYNQGFVYPRIMPIRKDVAVMTHESEIVNSTFAAWIIAESTGLRHQLTKVEDDIASTRILINSFHFSTLPDEAKSAANNDLAQLERQRDEIKKRRDDAVAQLIKADSWPATPLTDAENQELEKHYELRKNVAQLQEQVESINAMLRDGKTPDHDAMDVDSSSRPLKRRRGDESDAVPPENEPGPTKEQLEQMKSRIVELESIFTTFSNELVVRDEDMQQRIQAEVESQLDVASTSANDVYEEVSANIRQTGEEVGTMAAELAQLMLKADDQKKELEAVRARIATSQAQFQEMQNKFHQLEEERQKDRKTIAALEEAVKTYTEETPQPAVPGLTHDQIIHLMDEPLLDIVRAHIQPLLEQLRNKVQEMLNTQNSEMYRALWGKLSLTLRMVETISKRLERIDQASGSAPPIVV